MTASGIEHLIDRRGAAVLRCQANADGCGDALMKNLWRDEARIAARDVALLIELRDAETVQRMERERGLA